MFGLLEIGHYFYKLGIIRRLSRKCAAFNRVNY